MLATDDVVDILSVPLIGVVPESKDVLKASNVGLPITLSDENSPAAKAYTEATRRLLGENIPVTIPEEKKSLLRQDLQREGRMNLLSLFGKRGESASVAKNRLQILLAHERADDGSDAVLISSLREDILAVVAKRVEIDPDSVRLEMDRSGDVTTLGIDIELPSARAS